MSTPAPTWLDALPTDRLITEFSIWSADLVRLADDLARIEPYADLLHIDVADGHFAPALLFFPDLVAAIRRVSAKPIHVHLMVADEVLLSQIRQFVEAGADLISMQLENEAVIEPALDLLDGCGIAAGMVLQVDTSVAPLARHLDRIRFVTLLGTAIGVKGQGLDERATERLGETESLLAAARQRRRIVLAADGGIRERTVPRLRQAGAESVVLGSLAFGAPDLAERMRWLHAL